MPRAKHGERSEYFSMAKPWESIGIQAVKKSGKTFSTAVSEAYASLMGIEGFWIMR